MFASVVDLYALADARARRRLFSPAYAYLRTLRCFLRVFSVDIALFFFLGVSASISDLVVPVAALLLLPFAKSAGPQRNSRRSAGSSPQPPPLQSSSPLRRGPARAFSAAAAGRRVRSTTGLSTRFEDAPDARGSPTRRSPAAPGVRRRRLPRLSHVTRHHLLQATGTLRPGSVRDARGGDVVVLGRRRPCRVLLFRLCVSLSTKRRTSSTIARSSSSISSSSPSSGSSRGSSPAACRASANASSAPGRRRLGSPRSSTHPPGPDFSSVAGGVRDLRRVSAERQTRADTRAHG